MDVELLLTGHTAEELFREWRRLSEIRRTAGETTEAIGLHWRAVTDRVEKEKVWARYERACRDYDVVAAWTELFYSAYMFACRGSESRLLTPDRTREPALAG